MKVAVPVWENRVSPVFDTASRVLVVDFQDGKEVLRYHVEIPGQSPPEKVAGLRASGVVILLCGAISRQLLDLLVTAGIEVWPFRAGPADELLRAFIEDRISDPRYLMPGCWGTRRSQKARRRNRNRHRKEP
jgi:predicted Fe-Mo cluster-binding NifX family protein